MVQLSHLYMTTITLIIQTFVGKVMSLFFNMLSRFVIIFLPRSKCLSFMAAVTIPSDFGAPQNKICHYFHFSPFYLPCSTLATSCEELTHWKRLWCWEGLGEREGDDRGWDGWMASLTWWTWVSVNSRSWWWTGRPGVLRFMGLQRVRHDWMTELIWSDLICHEVMGPAAMIFVFWTFFHCPCCSVTKSCLTLCDSAKSHCSTPASLSISSSWSLLKPCPSSWWCHPTI